MLTPLTVVGLVTIVAGLSVIAWPLVRERRYRRPRCPECDAQLDTREVTVCGSCKQEVEPLVSRAWGGQQRVRSTIASSIMAVGAALIVVPHVMTDGLYAFAPDMTLVRLAGTTQNPDDDRVKLITRRLSVGSLSENARHRFIEDAVKRLHRSDDPVDWRFVAVVFAGMRPNDAGLTGALITGLQHENEKIREQAAYALGAIGNNESLCVPLLGVATRDKVPSVRAMSAWALRNFARDAELDPEAIAALNTLLFDSVSTVRYQAAEALMSLLDDRSRLVPHLIEGLGSTDSFTRLRAVGALQRVGDMSAIPALEQARSDRDKSVARAAEQAIAKITAQAGAPTN
jgi:hypothetical protein